MRKPGNAAHALMATAFAALLARVLPLTVGTGGRAFDRVCGSQFIVTVFCLGIWPVLLKVPGWPTPDKENKEKKGSLQFTAVSALLGVGAQFGLGHLTEQWISLMKLEREMSVPLPAGVMEWTVAVLVLAVLPALAEEWFFRGMVYRGLAEKISPFAAATVATVLFAAAHRSLNALPAMLIFGALASLLVRRGGKMRYGIVFHLCYNLTALALMAV